MSDAGRGPDAGQRHTEKATHDGRGKEEVGGHAHGPTSHEMGREGTTPWQEAKGGDGPEWAQRQNERLCTGWRGPTTLNSFSSSSHTEHMALHLKVSEGQRKTKLRGACGPASSFERLLMSTKHSTSRSIFLRHSCGAHVKHSKLCGFVEFPPRRTVVWLSKMTPINALVRCQDPATRLRSCSEVRCGLSTAHTPETWPCPISAVGSPRYMTIAL